MEVATIATQNEHQQFTNAQIRVLSSIPSVVGPFSMLGSGLIIYIIWKERRQLFKSSYDRIMLGLSVCDVISSVAFTFFGPWSIPEDAAPFVVGARASSRIPCILSGFLVHFTFGSVLYTAALMIYFALLVRFEWRPEKIAKHVEPWLHGTAIIATLVTGVVAVVGDYMNPAIELPGTCWISPYPPDCELRDEVQCIRGGGSLNFVRSISVIPFLTMLVVVVTMVLLVLKVRSTEQRLLRYRIPNEAGGRSGRRHNSATESSNYERTHRTAKRGLAYIGAFMVSMVPIATFNVVFRRRPIKVRGAAFLVSLIMTTFIPLQGFFNAIIYIRPKWKELTTKGRSLYFLAVMLSWMTPGRENEKKKKDGWFCCCSGVLVCGNGGRHQQEQDRTWPGADSSLNDPKHQEADAPTNVGLLRKHDIVMQNSPDQTEEDDGACSMQQHERPNKNDPEQQKEFDPTTTVALSQKHLVENKRKPVQKEEDVPTTADPSQLGDIAVTTVHGRGDDCTD